MAQVICCDVCGRTEHRTTVPSDWGYVFRPISHAVRTVDLPAAQAEQRKDLCGGCSYSLSKLLDELRRRLQQRHPSVSTTERDEVVTALLTTGEEKALP
jgi:hypothetical protein